MRDRFQYLAQDTGSDQHGILEVIRAGVIWVLGSRLGTWAGIMLIKQKHPSHPCHTYDHNHNFFNADNQLLYSSPEKAVYDGMLP